MSRSQGPSVGLRVPLFSQRTRSEPPGVREKLGSAGGTRSWCPYLSPAASGCLRLRRGAGGGAGEGVSASSPRARPYNSLPRSLSDSLGLGAGARLSRCLSPTLPSRRLPPEPRGLRAGSPGGRRAQAGARAEASSPEPVSLEPEPHRARAPRAASASLGSRDSGNGVSRPGGWSRGRVGGPRARVFTCRTSAVRPRSPAAAGLLCRNADVWRVLGKRERRLAFPPGRGAGGQCEASRG